MEKPWRLISNADGIDDDFVTLDEALKAANETLALWRDQASSDGEWDEDVEGVEIHLVTHAARITMRDGDNEDDGVDYGITEILGNEIDEESRKLRADYDKLCDEARYQGAEISALKEALRPFANYACDPPCGCHNCRAKELLSV